jgi:hypothetical protein
MAEWKQCFRRPMHWITFLEQVNKIIKWRAFLKSKSYELATQIYQTTEKIKIFALEKRAIKTRTKAYDKQQNPDFST